MVLDRQTTETSVFQIHSFARLKFFRHEIVSLIEQHAKRTEAGYNREESKRVTHSRAWRIAEWRHFHLGSTHAGESRSFACRAAVLYLLLASIFASPGRFHALTLFEARTY